jgi:hypothetical protein
VQESVVETGAVPEEEADEQLVKLAHLIVPLSQAAAKELIEQVKAVEPPAQRSPRHIAAEHAPIRQFKAGRRSTAKRREEAGFITCSCCNRVLKLIHQADGRHTVMDTPFTRYPMLSEPEVPNEPTAAALNPAPATAPALAASEMPPPILKQTAGYSLDKIPKGLDAVLTLQTVGFWGKLECSPANPDFSEADVPERIYTVNPWLGCLWGTSCKGCYVPSADTRHYPAGQQSYWYRQWGNRLLYKPDITRRLRKQLLDGTDLTRPTYQGAAIYMSPKTDPLLPIKDALQITARITDSCTKN